ncbi:MAG: DUF2061 domain-containing protein [Candidatus Omnitrophica bacterium]|nr:DUF2061 domain-containing protein [Candidatus Omnitrophota bacterium]
MDNPKRSLAKAVTWRLFGFLTTVVLVLLYTRNVKQALMVGASLDGLKIILYYFHERFWNKVKFGRTSDPEYQI